MARAAGGKRAANAMAKVMELLQAQGVDTSNMKPTAPVADVDYRSNDAVAVFANEPSHFRAALCIECKQPFGVNRKSVGFCSSACRRDNWKKTTGIEWGAVSTNDPWDGDPPMIITATQLANLQRIVEWFKQSEKALTVETETEPEVDHLEDSLPQEQSLPQLPEPFAVPVFSLDSDVPQTSPDPAPFALSPIQMFGEVMPFGSQ